MSPPVKSDKLHDLTFRYEHWRRSLKQLGSLYPKGQELIPLAQFLIYQLSYWQAGCPMEAPGLLFVNGDGCDRSAFNCLQASQGFIDQYHPSPSPDDAAIAEIISAEITRLRAAPPPGGLSGSAAYGRVQRLMLNFSGVKARALESARITNAGVIHDLRGHIQLRVLSPQDQAALRDQIAYPGWLSKPKGLFLRNESLQPVRANLTGLFHPVWVDPLTAKGLQDAVLPLILTSGSLSKTVSLENQQNFMETSGYLSGWIQAARIQTGVSPQLQIHSHPKLDFHGVDSGDLDRSRLAERFAEAFGKLDHLPKEHSSHLAKTHSHLWSYAYWFARTFVGHVKGDHSEAVRRLTHDFRIGVEQLIAQHLGILSYFAIGEENLSALSAKLLLHLRGAEEGASGRQICRKFSVSAKVRDQAVEELTNKQFLVRRKEILFATSLGGFLSNSAKVS